MDDIDDLIASMEDFDGEDDSDMSMDMGSDIFGSGGGNMGSSFDSDDESGDSEDDSDESEEDVESRHSLFKKSLTYLGIAIVFCLAVLVVGGFVKSKVMNKKSVNNNTVAQSDVNKNVGNNQANSQENSQVDNQGGEQSNVSQAPVSTSQSGSDGWKEIDGTAEIQFNSEYSKITFTVTKVTHMVKSIPGSSDVMIVSKVMGSLAGMTGTYEFNIPYNKGIRLNIGSSFDVDVLLGQYGDITVVGDIQP